MNPIFYGLYTVFQKKHKQQYNEEYDDNDFPQYLKYVIIGFAIFIVVLIFV
jgi:hypothetical protein